jgi:hypothetical protein
MAPSTVLAGQPEVVRRINRYSTLRGAERALSPSIRLSEAGEPDGPGVDLLVKLRKLLLDVRAVGGPTPDLPERLDEVDAQLAAMTDRVRARLTSTSMAHLRSTLPLIARDARGEASALLDFCIDDAGVAPEHAPLVEYLVTLLSCSQDRGAQIVRCDPTRVTASVERLCHRARSEADGESDRAARELFRAAFEVTGLRDLVPLVRRMRNVKSELGDRLFTTEVLRNAVAYNVAVANRIEVLMEIERLRDERERRLLDELRALDAAEAGGDARRNPSVLDSPGFHSVCEAVRDRLTGVEPVPGPSAKIASQVDVSRFGAEAVRAFGDAHDEGAAPLLRAALVLGGILETEAALDDHWRALEIDPTTPERVWADELDHTLAAAADQLSACGRNSEAGALSRARRGLARD